MDLQTVAASCHKRVVEFLRREPRDATHIARLWDCTSSVCLSLCPSVRPWRL